MYYIYHIPGIKIGCSKEPEVRVQRQGYTDFEILEEHFDINTASQRERELQIKWGYRVDNTLYSQSHDWCLKGYSKGGQKTGELLRDSGEWEIRRQRGVEKAKEVVSKPIIVLHYPSGEFHSEWPSIQTACKELGLDRSAVIGLLSKSIGKNIKRRVCNHHHHYTFQYKSIE